MKICWAEKYESRLKESESLGILRHFFAQSLFLRKVLFFQYAVLLSNSKKPGKPLIFSLSMAPCFQYVNLVFNSYMPGKPPIFYFSSAPFFDMLTLTSIQRCRVKLSFFHPRASYFQIWKLSLKQTADKLIFPPSLSKGILFATYLISDSRMSRKPLTICFKTHAVRLVYTFIDLFRH